MSLIRWGTKGTLSIVDQGLLSSANFVLNIAYARWLSPEQYGAFAILLACFLFLTGFHNALLLEPLSVLGPKQEAASKPGYVSSLLLLHAALTGSLAAVLAIAGAFVRLKNPAMGDGLIGVALTLPVILLFWLLRRICYLSADAGRAVRGSLVYAAAVILLLVLLKATPSPVTGFAIMAVAAAAASGVLLRKEDLRWEGVRMTEMFRDHWRYGRWVLGIACLYWLAGPTFVPLVGLLKGVESAATLRAAENPLLALGQIFAALSVLLLPWLSGEVDRDGIPRLRALTWRTSSAAALIAGAYGLVLMAGGQRLLTWLYAPRVYRDLGVLVPILCAAAILRGVSDFGFGLSLKAAGQSDATFWGSLGAAIVSLVGGIWLVKQYGVIGAAWAALLATAVQAVILGYRFVSFHASRRAAERPAYLEAAEIGEAS